MNSDLQLKQDKKGKCYILSHKRCGITECIWLTSDELQQLDIMIRYGTEIGERQRRAAV